MLFEHGVAESVEKTIQNAAYRMGRRSKSIGETIYFEHSVSKTVEKPIQNAADRLQYRSIPIPYI